MRGDWDEREHPREPAGSERGGRFRDRDTWAGAALDRLTGSSLRVRGQDLQQELSIKLVPLVVEQHDTTTFHSDDPILVAIAREQGFDGPPQIVSEREMDRLVEDGQVIEMWRGVGGYDVSMTERVSAADAAEQYRSGDAYYGTGMYGNGIYAAKARRYAVGAARDGVEGLLRIGLRADATILDYGDLDEEVASEYGEGPAADLVYNWGNATREQLRRGARNYPWIDPGRLAAARGADAIRVARGAGDFFIILNRTATVVQEASPAGVDVA